MKGGYGGYNKDTENDSDIFEKLLKKMIEKEDTGFLFDGMFATLTEKYLLSVGSDELRTILVRSRTSNSSKAIHFSLSLSYTLSLSRALPIDVCVCVCAWSNKANQLLWWFQMTNRRRNA